RSTSRSTSCRPGDGVRVVARQVSWLVGQGPSLTFPALSASGFDRVKGFATHSCTGSSGLKSLPDHRIPFSAAVRLRRHHRRAKSTEIPIICKEAEKRSATIQWFRERKRVNMIAAGKREGYRT